MKKNYLRWSRLGTITILLAAFLLVACIGIVTQPVSAQEPVCSYQICLTDDYGDGWNGGYVDVYVNAMPVYTLTLASGNGPECYPISVNTGDDITVYYTPGSWPYENEYHIYNSLGILVRSEGIGGVEPGDVPQGELYVLCENELPSPSPVPTMSQWGMIGMAIVLAAALVWAVRRRWVVKTGES